jgi:hypothetical protein
MVVFRVQIARISRDQMDRLTAAFQGDRPNRELSIGRELPEMVADIVTRQQHRVAEVPACRLVAQHVRQQDPLVDFVTFLVALRQRIVGSNLLARRRQPRAQIGCRIGELLHAQKSLQIVRQAVVELADVGLQKPCAGAACALMDEAGCLGLHVVALRFWRQPRDELGGQPPELAEESPVGREIGGDRRLGAAPAVDLRRERVCGLTQDRECVRSLWHGPAHVCFGRRSMTRFALPCERSIVPGATTRTRVVTPT